MNILLISSKEERAAFEAVVKSAPNANLINSLQTINDQFIDDLEERYHPHCIVWVNGVKVSNGKSEIDTLKEIKERYPYIRIIYFTGEEEYENIIDELTELDIFDVVDRNITSVEFNVLLNEPFKNRQATDDFNKKKIRVVFPSKKKKKFNLSLLLPIGILIVLAILIVVLLVVKNNPSENEDEDVTESVTMVSSKSPTQATIFVLSTNPPTEKPTQTPTKATEKATEKVTQQPTQKPTEKATEKEKTTSSGGNSNNPASGLGGAIQQPAQQPVQQVEQPVQQPIQQIEQPVQQPQQTVTDDGQIHFDKDSYVVNVGETFDIYVSGLVAANGCNWNLTNNAIAEFVSSDVTKVTLKAKAKGSTVITGTAKSNGASRQVLVTVE